MQRIAPYLRPAVSAGQLPAAVPEDVKRAAANYAAAMRRLDQLLTRTQQLQLDNLRSRARAQAPARAPR